MYVSMFFGTHDSGVAFANHDRVLLHLDAERVLRRKHALASPNEMEALVRIGLKALGGTIDQVETLFVGRWGCIQSHTVTVLGRTFFPVWTNHHANHVGYGRSLDWSDAVAVCADGGSEVGCSGVYRFDGQKYEPLADLDETILTGKFYGTLTQMVLGTDFEDAHIESPGRTMGLSRFGRDDDEIRAKILDYGPEMSRLHANGVGDLLRAFGLSNHDHLHSWGRWNLAATAQNLFEEQWIKTLERFARLSPRLIFAGGCALNVLVNRRIQQSELFQSVFTPPCSGDDGQAIGALVHQLGSKFEFPFLGRSFGEMESCPDEAVTDLVEGRIVAWFNGRSEVGPRALGHRSFLALPDRVSRRVRLNEVVKRREWYRPVAAVIREEVAGEWFDIDHASPYMLEAVPARMQTRERAPAVVHVDGSCRIQTVSKEQDPVLYELLEGVEAVTGLPLLMNTSLNLPREPICETPSDALATFRASGADVIYLPRQRVER